MTDSNTPPPAPESPGAPSISQSSSEAARKKKKGCLIAGIIGGLLLICLIGFLIWFFFFRSNKFDPTVLTEPEKVHLADKMEALPGGADAVGDMKALPDDGKPVEMERPPLVDVDGRDLPEGRTLVLTEKEINAMLHHNTGLGEKVYINLDQDKISAKVVHTFAEETAVVGGRTFRGKIGVEVFVDEKQQLNITIRDVSVGVLSLPSAWLGGLKNKNLIEEYGDEGFLKAFAAGIEQIVIENGELVLVVAE